ncbi:Protein AF-9 -like protein [Nakaseomyces glabratus]|uniref:Protein AF-9 homolog n=1 Tax=Candida glabrata TaxID=5478 RepID=A0A0W0DP31_CANGB|nr:YEATS domain profile [Nakaseomyces glabratus]KAH7598327.1 YEATS domain profile [Nakaseomyces glabratus]KAJ9570732.1 NuA4 histone H4 acetyltransferase complex and the SWR1 complex subunit [Nakaseomyces glabratus]KTA96728.1 Protein AF-9 -like protein [Nakaseomyces glabratus]KTB03511.1 Protein AF-9 -like protein [Nakaseomyces glabratus]
MAPPTSKRIKTLSVSRAVIYGNTAKKIGENRPPNAPSEHTHLWTIFVRSPTGDDISYFIKKVVFKLHETYPNPVRTIEAPPFELTETGWGEFDINIKIYFVEESNEKFINFYHRLRLHPYVNVNPPMSTEVKKEETGNTTTSDEISSIFYDEIVFNEPYEDFFKILVSKPGNLLPSNKTEDCLFSRQLEQDELTRIKMASSNVDKEIEIYKKKLEDTLKSR